MTSPTIPQGQRLYAIGDIHGRLDLLEAMVARIRQDNARRGPAATRIVALGDMIDRGPQSAQIVHRLHAYSRASHRFIVLRGNHEEMMVRSLSGDLSALKAWLRFGGDATLRSWGLSDETLAGPLMAVKDAALEAVPRPQLDWLRRLPLSYRLGDYFFVHAGVRPGVPLEDQSAQDLLWLSLDFTDSAASHGAVVVHGHTIEEHGPVFRANRIGLDTGAYRTGRLTALGLEGVNRWALTARLDPSIGASEALALA